MAREFGVDNIVEGSVRLEPGRVRITVELVDATTEHTLWSEQYERGVSDVLSVQSEVALRIAQALAATLSPAERERVEKLPTKSAEAYQLYLRAQALGGLADTKRNVEAIKLLNEALALDPQFALAKARLSYRVFFRAYTEDRKYADDAIALALEAVAIDPALADPHFTLGSAYGIKGRIEQARLSFLRALELDPNNTSSMSNLSYTYALGGRLDESLYWARRMFPLSAKRASAYYHVAVPLLWLRDDQLTRRWLTDAEQQPAHPRTQIMLAALQVYDGNSSAALARMRAATAQFAGDSEAAFTLNDLAILAAAPDAEALNERMFRSSPEVAGVLLPESGRVRYAYLLQKRGDARARSLLEAAESSARARIAVGDIAANTFVDLAAARALQGDTKSAIAELQNAYDNGWRDYGVALLDPMLTALRDDPDFRALLDRAVQDVAAQRERAKTRGLLDLSSLLGRPLP